MSSSSEDRFRSDAIYDRALTGLLPSEAKVTCLSQTYPVEKSDTVSIEGSRVSSVRDQNPLE